MKSFCLSIFLWAAMQQRLVAPLAMSLTSILFKCLASKRETPTKQKRLGNKNQVRPTTQSS